MKLQYIKLGTDCNKEERGFSGKGGGWDLYKMFYDEAEFYFNINTKTGEAEIALKDSGYATKLIHGFTDTVLGQEIRNEIDREEVEEVTTYY